MKHRHLLVGFETSTAAIADVLERGSLEDWRGLARAVRDDPWGVSARAMERALDFGPHLVGTSPLWRAFLAAARSAGSPAPGPTD